MECFKRLHSAIEASTSQMCLVMVALNLCIRECSLMTGKKGEEFKLDFNFFLEHINQPFLFSSNCCKELALFSADNKPDCIVE